MYFRDVRIEKKNDNLFEATAVLSFCYENNCDKTFEGKITRTMKANTGNEWTDMYGLKYYQAGELREEARRAALSIFFKEVYGYTDTSDIEVDEFDRPLKKHTEQSCLNNDCLTIDLTTET